MSEKISHPHLATRLIEKKITRIHAHARTRNHCFDQHILYHQDSYTNSALLQRRILVLGEHVGSQKWAPRLKNWVHRWRLTLLLHIYTTHSLSAAKLSLRQFPRSVTSFSASLRFKSLRTFNGKVDPEQWTISWDANALKMNFKFHYLPHPGERTTPDTLPQIVRQVIKGHLHTGVVFRQNQTTRIKLGFYSGSEIDETGLATKIAIGKERKQLDPGEADERIRSLEELSWKANLDEESMKTWIRCVRFGSKDPNLKSVGQTMDKQLKASGRRSPNALFYK